MLLTSSVICTASHVAEHYYPFALPGLQELWNSHRAVVYLEVPAECLWDWRLPRVLPCRPWDHHLVWWQGLLPCQASREAITADGREPNVQHSFRSHQWKWLMFPPTPSSPPAFPSMMHANHRVWFIIVWLDSLLLSFIWTNDSASFMLSDVFEEQMPLWCVVSYPWAMLSSKSASISDGESDALR